MDSNALDACLIAEDRGQDIPVPTQTLCEILMQSARLHPDKIALVSCHQSCNLLPSMKLPVIDDQRYLRWTYAQLEDASERLASSLARRGLRKGTALVAVLHKCAEWALCLWAAARLGCLFVPINPVLATRAHELQHMLSFLEVGALIVHDDSIAKQISINTSLQVQEIGIRLVASGSGETDWEALDGFLQMRDAPVTKVEDQDMNDTALVIFTSGTTSLPKACPHSNRTIAAICHSAAINFELNENQRSCNVMPIFHLGGVIESLPIWAVGGTVVYPNKHFDAQSTLEAIEREKCTDILLVPTMLHALLDSSAFSTGTTSSLAFIKLGGAAVSAADVRLCNDVLHVSQVTNSYGLTESGFITRPFQINTAIKAGDAIISGRMAPGARARICLPDSRAPLKRGKVGELHEGGTMVISEYIGGDNSSFYTDKVGLWHTTGDQAIMAETGEISILGRYKDMIIRAGMNISPPTIERVLDQVEGLTSQVIGIPDDVAGEVPVAVVKMVNGCNVSKIWLQEYVIRNLGATFALERVMDLREFGIDDFPRTPAGKVRKVDIRRLVQELLGRASNTAISSTNPESTEAALTRIWARFLGMPGDRILPTISLEGIVDSVTVMRFRHQVRKELGKFISLEELNENTNIKAQAQVLDRKTEKLLAEVSRITSRQSAPGVGDVVHACGDSVEFTYIRELVERELHGLGLSWDVDVEEILPIWDFGQVFLDPSGLRSGRFRVAFTYSNVTRNQLRTALERTLSNHSILRTLAVRHGSLHHLHIVIRPSSRWFKVAITNARSVEDLEGLRTLNLSPTEHEDPTSPPVPPALFHITTSFVESQGSAAFIVYGNHSVFDATSLSMFLEDLGNVLINERVKLSPRASYNLFANAYYSHRASVQSQTSLKNHVTRLKGIGKLRDALWPARYSSQALEGEVTSLEHDEGSLQKSCDRTLLEGGTSQGVKGFTRRAKLAAMGKLQSEHKVSHAVVIKTAVALLNIQQTGQSHALFANTQLCRSWPFLEKHIADFLPDPMDIPGPTIEYVFNKIELRPEEPVLALLQRLQSEQDGLTEHARVPMLALREQLGREDGDMLVEILRRQFFQYAPLLQSEKGSSLQLVDWQGHGDVAIAWNCGMVDAETFHMLVTYNDEAFRPAEVENLLIYLMQIIQWVIDPVNWGKAVKECHFLRF
ncbi:hypothetical protein MMC28_011321 [Mycoblastus sanguinarius]|nr:hypothetical protein [Mycoblastus sanguinarius]